MLLAIDPGREKCGLAVGEGRVILARAIVPAAALGDTAREWARRFSVDRILLGDRTGAEIVRHQLSSAFPGVPIVLVSEQGTTLLARHRYFADHPPRGWRRLLPLSMQVPPEPYDDYAAAVILERYGPGAEEQGPENLRKNL